MARVLAVADEVDEGLYADGARRVDVDLVVSCGDLPFEYLEYLVTVLNVPLLYVPGNHDPDLARRPRARRVVPRLVGVPQIGLEPVPEPPSGPQGCVNVDRRVERAAGLRVGGLGGSVRYREGVNQYSQGEMLRGAVRLGLRAAVRGGLDILVTHAPPAGLGDREDPAHRGFEAFHRLVGWTRPRILVHGHVHPYGIEQPDRRIGDTVVVNAVPSRVLEVEA